MPHIKIKQPTENGYGTTVELDGRRLEHVTSIDYHVDTGFRPELKIGTNILNAEYIELDLNADHIKLDISPTNVESSVLILRHALTKDNPAHKHKRTENELRKGFIASIDSVVHDSELAERILDRIIGDDIHEVGGDGDE